MNDSPECAFHSKHILTNFCMNRECWLPLCPECINIHLEEHRMSRTDPIINTLENVRFDIVQRISNLSTSFRDLNSNFQNIRKSDINKEAKLFDKIDLAKQKVLNVVESYFNSLKTDIKDFHSSKKCNRNSQLSKFHNLIEERNREIETFLHKLTSDNFVKYIVMLHSRNTLEELDNEYQKLNKELEVTDISYPEVKLDENALHGLNIELARFINFTCKETTQQMPIAEKEKLNNSLKKVTFSPVQGTPPRISRQIYNENPMLIPQEYRSLTPDKITIYPTRAQSFRNFNESRIPPPLQPLKFDHNSQMIDRGFITKMASGSPPHHLMRNSVRNNNSMITFSNAQPNIIVESNIQNRTNIGGVIKDQKKTRSISHSNNISLNHSVNPMINDNSIFQKVDRMSLVNKNKPYASNRNN